MGNVNLNYFCITEIKSSINGTLQRSYGQKTKGQSLD